MVSIINASTNKYYTNMTLKYELPIPYYKKTTGLKVINYRKLIDIHNEAQAKRHKNKNKTSKQVLLAQTLSQKGTLSPFATLNDMKEYIIESIHELGMQTKSIY